MNTAFNRLTLVTNGSPATLPSLELGAWLAEKMNLPVHLLCLREAEDAQHPVSAVADAFLPKLQAAAVSYTVEFLNGQAERLLPHSLPAGDDLLVLGPLGRPLLTRLLVGRTFRHFMEDLRLPILYVPRLKLPICSVLVCMGGLDYALDVTQAALALSAPLCAQVTFLHVVEPVNLDYPLSHEVESHWQTLLSTDTPQGRILREAVAQAEAQGLGSTVKLRHGAIITEIMSEVKSGAYDLVCMGSMYSAHSLRHITLPNVTAEVAEAGLCPVLSVRSPANP